MENPYLHRTHYSRHFTTWVKRIVALLLIVMVTVAWIFADDEYDSWWVLFPVLILIGLSILFSTVDDLAVSQTEFFHLKTSPLKFLNKSEAYVISKMSSIKSFTDNNRVSDQGKYNTIIEMTFNDGSVKNFKVPLLKKDVEEYMERVGKMISNSSK